MGKVRFSSAPKSVIDKQSITKGKFYVSTDTKEFYCDTPSGSRIRISDIEFLNKDSERTSLLAPLNKFYYVLETSKLWYYNESWNQIGPGNPLTIKVNNVLLATYTGQQNIEINITKENIGLGRVVNVSTNDQKPTFVESVSLSALVSGENLSVLMGKISKAVSTLISHIANKNNPHGVSKSNVGLSNVTNDKQIKGLSTGTTDNHVIVFGADGYTVKDSGFTIGKSVPSNAVFTDTKYAVATSTKNGLLAFGDFIKLSKFSADEAGFLAGVTSPIQDQLDGKAPKSHGTHVSFATTTPLAPGTASAGKANTVSRSDHVHPAQTTVSGNAGTATKLKTARTINGVAFDGSKNIDIGIDDGVIS